MGVPPRRSSSVISVIRSWVRAPRMASRATKTTSCPSTPRGATSRIAARRIAWPGSFAPRRRSSCRRPARTPRSRERQTVPSAFRAPVRHHGRHAGSPECAPTRSAGDAEAAAALASACGEDRPTGARSHPQTESVGLRPTAGVRLIRALSLGHPRILRENDGRQPAGRRGSIRKHPWMEGLTTERASRR